MSTCIVDPKYILIDGVNDGEVYGISDFADNEIQFDDKLDNDYQRREELLHYWGNIEQYEQKSKLWLQQRSQFIGGSEAGAALGVNHYEPPYKVIWKKLETIPFTDFTAVYHGNKYEDVSNMVYEWIYNVKIGEYGFLPHRSINILGASPDGITTNKKHDGIHITNKNGIMIEIKMPTSRKINMNPNADMFDIIPKYYYAQIQQQMEVCDFEYTDFCQFKIVEYGSFKEFRDDTSDDCYFKTRDGKFKGAVIQILPIKDFQNDELTMPDKKLKQKVYAHAKFIHQPRINMTVNEIKQWVLDVRSQNLPSIQNEEIMKHYKIKDGYFFNCVKWYKVDHGRIKRFKRNREWIKNNMEKYEDLWKKVEFFRNENNQGLKTIFCKICNMIEREVFFKNAKVNEENQQRMEKVINILMSGNQEQIDDISNTYDVNEYGFIEE